MGRFFSDKVETAIRYIYYDLGAQRGQEVFRLLQEACREGDADAYCLLARCLYGQEYTWLGHDFPVDEDAADELIYQSVMMGSALGTLIAMRCGVMNKELQEAMPLASLKTAYDIILEKAKAGDAFCQMVIGNVYYWYDFLMIEDINPEDFDSDEAFESFIHENMLKCEYWYKSALDGGVATAGATVLKAYCRRSRKKPKSWTAFTPPRATPTTSIFMLAICSMKINTRKPFPCSARQRRPVNRALTFLWAIITKTALPHRTTTRKPQSITKKLSTPTFPLRRVATTAWARCILTVAAWNRITTKPSAC